MDRAYLANAVGTPPAPPAAPSVGYPVGGDPAISQPATKPGKYWFYMMTEEIRGVITWAGMTPDQADVTQLRQAIVKLLAASAKSITIDGAVFGGGVTNGEVVRWNSGAGNFVEAIADGTSNNRAVGVADVTNGKVYVYGETPAIFSGLTPGGRYYLSSATAGSVTLTPPSDSLIIGIAKSATVVFVDIDVDIFSLLNQRNVWNRAQDVAQVTLTDAATIATDAALSNVFLVTLAGNRTLANPTNLVAGQTIVFHIRQDVTGGRTLSFSSLFKFVGGTPQVSSSANSKDMLTCIYDGADLLCSLQKGFA